MNAYATGVKVVYLVTKLPELDDERFVEHWTTTHAALAATMPGLRGYSINLPSPLQRGTRAVDGYAMLRFDTYADLKRAWTTPEGRATAEDGRLFMADASPVIVDESVVVSDSAKGMIS